MIKSVFLFVLLLTGFLFSQTVPADSINYYYQKSTQAYQSGDYGNFLRYTQKSLSLSPQNFTLQYNLACAWALNGRTTEALDIIRGLAEKQIGIVTNVETDPDLEAVRKLPEFVVVKELIEPLLVPVIRSEPAFTIDEPDLIPEGMTYDRVEKSFYMGSLYKSKIIKIDAAGNTQDFVRERQDGLVPVVGMKVDPERRLLWAVTGYGTPREKLPSELLGTAGVFKYDLASAALIKKYMLPRGERHFLNDLVLTKSGDVYITDSNVPAIYRISATTDTIEKFMDLPGVPYPNGIDISPDEHRLFVAANDIYSVDLATKTFKALQSPENVILSGDGLYFYRNSLIAVQNETYNRIARFYLNKEQDAVDSLQILEANNPGFDIPTTGVVVDGYFYFISNSQLNHFDREGRIFPSEKLNPVKVLRIRL